MSTTCIGTQLDSICDGLKARANLCDVNVFSGAVTSEEAGPECIAFGQATLDEINFSMGGNRQEKWTVDGEIRVVKPWAGDTELTIRAARDRCLELFAEVETYLNDTYLGSLPDSTLTEGEIHNDFGPEGRICRLPFGFQILNVVNP